MKIYLKAKAAKWWSLSVLIVLAAACTANAAAIPWANDTGSNARFSWTAGQSGEGLWGNPTAIGAGFLFNDMAPAFTAEANGTAGSVTSTLKVTMTAIGDSFEELHIREWGTFEGAVPDVSGSSGTLSLLVMSPMPPGEFNIGSLDFDFNASQGTWTAGIDVDLTSLSMFLTGGVDSMAITVTNHLSALIGTEHTEITKTGGSIIIPEPATFVLGLIGLLAISRRRLS